MVPARARGRSGSLEQPARAKGRSGSLEQSAQLPIPAHIALKRARAGSVPAPAHSRMRSHFSIPDLVITGVEEEGQEEHFEVKLADEDRRAELSYQPPPPPPEQPVHEHSSTRIRSTLNSLLGLGIGLEGVDETQAANSSVLEPICEKSSGSPPVRPSKPSRKSSFTAIFTRKAENQAAAKEPRNAEGTKRAREQPDGSENDPPTPGSSPYQSAFESSGSLALVSSRESIPNSSPQSPSSPFTASPGSQWSAAASPRMGKSPQSASTSPTTPPAHARHSPSLSKKERKAKAKEEQAMLKELQKVDKLVRKHDAAEAKKTDKASKAVKAKAPNVANIDGGKENAAPLATKAMAPLKRLTMFSATSKGSSNTSRKSSGPRRERPASVAGKRVSARQSAAYKVIPKEASTADKGDNSNNVQRGNPSTEAAHAATASTWAVAELDPAQKGSDESARPTFTDEEWRDLALDENCQEALASLTSVDNDEVPSWSSGTTSPTSGVEEQGTSSTRYEDMIPTCPPPVGRRSSKRPTTRSGGENVSSDYSHAHQAAQRKRQSVNASRRSSRRKSSLLGHRGAVVAHITSGDEADTEGWEDSSEGEKNSNGHEGAADWVDGSSVGRSATPVSAVASGGDETPRATVKPPYPAGTSRHEIETTAHKPSSSGLPASVSASSLPELDFGTLSFAPGQILSTKSGGKSGRVVSPFRSGASSGDAAKASSYTNSSQPSPTFSTSSWSSEASSSADTRPSSDEVATTPEGTPIVPSSSSSSETTTTTSEQSPPSSSAASSFEQHHDSHRKPKRSVAATKVKHACSASGRDSPAIRAAFMRRPQTCSDKCCQGN